MKDYKPLILVILFVVVIGSYVIFSQPTPIPVPTPTPEPTPPEPTPIITPTPTPTPEPPTPTPPVISTLPTDYIEIPDWITTPEDIQTWHEQLGSKWVSDLETTGHAAYHFTPVEFMLSEIPDVSFSGYGNTIKKTPYQGDCEDFAIFNTYVAYAALGYDCYIIYIMSQGNIHAAHAIAYGICNACRVNGSVCYVWDNIYYRGEWPNIDTFIEEKYPNWVIYHHEKLEDELQALFKAGHLEYAP